MKPYYQKNNVTLYLGDCVEVMRKLPNESVQCVVTSPPYDDLRTYNGYSWNFKKTARVLKRLVCGGGVVCWNVNDSTEDGSESVTSSKQKIYFHEKCGFNIHDTMIYEKLNFSNPEHVRYHQLFEYVFVLSKGAPRTFNPIKDKRNVWAGATCFGDNTFRKPDGSMGKRPVNKINAYGMRGNIWKGKTAGQEHICEALAHPAMMPLWLAHDLAVSWSDASDTILDPFAGYCTTAIACIKTNRQFIGIEISEEYCELSAKRIEAAFAQPMLDLEVA